MKRLSFILLFTFVCVACIAQSEHPLIKDCAITKNFGMSSETFFLWGHVRVVTDPKEYADFNVKIVSSPALADVYVKRVTSAPFECGEWHFVTSKKDAPPFTVTIRFVTEWEEFTICFVDSNPGSRY
ncbi:MAG: hypothetical protein LBT27_06540 [Prevotellaceae bacterium]|jgi:hypothetical protein|nr:hypothetical protein [Prevotellaceae bacterium]